MIGRYSVPRSLGNNAAIKLAPMERDKRGALGGQSALGIVKIGSLRSIGHGVCRKVRT
jgi:hypothetical protein